MGLTVTTTTARAVLTRTSGYLTNVTSHSLQPYRGCSFGHALCGAACYVQHNPWITRGRAWGSFLEAKVNAAEVYSRTVERERAWARRARGGFSVFLSSATDPFPPHEARLGVTRRVLAAMVESPPDELVVQTHGDGVLEALDLLEALDERGSVRVHVSIESDRDRLPGLPPPACSVERRIAACGTLSDRGLRVVVTCAPLLPIRDPDSFFARLAGVADAVVLDHFVEGDGTADGSRTRRTPLPDAIAAVEPRAVELAYRDAMAAIARRHFAGRVGIGAAGFAGRFGDASTDSGATSFAP